MLNIVVISIDSDVIRAGWRDGLGNDDAFGLW